MKTAILILTVAEFTILVIYQTAPASCLILAPLPPKRIDHRDIYHMEVDITNPDQLLVSSKGALGVFNTNSEGYHDIIGNGRLGYVDGYKSDAEFNWITGFWQINSTHVILADHDNHCIRLVDRVAQRATTLAGKCKEFGHKDGSMEESRFYRPYNIINASGEGDYYITDYQNHAIRILSLGSKKISTFYNSRDNLLEPISMFLDPNTKMLYVTLAYSVAFINTTGGIANLTAIRRNERLNKITQFDNTTLWLFSNPEESPGQNFVRQIDTTPGSNNDISLVPVNLPKDVTPQAAVLKKREKRDTLYIGQKEYIKETEIQESTTTTTTTMTTTTTTTTTTTMEPIEKSTSVEISETTTNDDCLPSECLVSTEKDESQTVPTNLHPITYAVMGMLLGVFICLVLVLTFILRKIKRRMKMKMKSQEDPTTSENLRNAIIELKPLTDTAPTVETPSTAHQETTRISSECEESCEPCQAIENEEECLMTVDVL